LEHRRILAVQRVLEGYSRRKVARFLGVSLVSVRRWMRAYRRGGFRRLKAAPVSGRPSHINGRQRRSILGWLSHSPLDFGFATDRWTAPRIARLMAERWQIHLHPRYVSRWLKRHGVTPQIPAKIAMERDEKVIQEWIAGPWVRIKKGRGD
jgi:transposase